MAENRNPRSPKEVKGRSPGSQGSNIPPGLTHKDSDEWGSIADLLKSIENTNRGGKQKAPPPSPQPRMPPLTENIQSAAGMPSLLELHRGQGMQQLNHLLRLMDQMCALQRQNSKLREQAEYLSAIKTLHELRNETLRQNCRCEGHRRVSDLSSSSGSRFEATHVTGESLSEPESQIGDDMDDEVRGRGEKRGRGSKRDGKKSMKKRSRSLDPFGDDIDGKDRSKQGLFSKIEKMKEKLTNRRGSVKRRTNSRGDGDDEGEDGKPGPLFHVDGIETKSEDSGIFHLGPEDLTSAARMEAYMRKSTDDLSDNEDIFQGSVPPSWARTAVLAQSRRKNSDLSTGSSSEDYLESTGKPKRSPGEDKKPVPMQVGGSQDADEIMMKRSRFRRTTSCHDDEEAEGDKAGAAGARSMGPVEEKLKQKRIQHQSHSLDIEMTDASGASERESGRMSGSESKQPQKRKYFRKSQTADFDDLSSSSVSYDGAFKDVRSPKASPPEKKKHRGWEKVKHAMSKKHLAEANRQRLMTSSTEESPPVANRQEMAEEGYLSPGESTDDGARRGARRDMAKKVQSQKKEKDPSQPPHEPIIRSRSNKSDHSNSSGISEAFARRLEEWEKIRLRNTGLVKQPSLDSGSDVPMPRTVDIEQELNKGLTEEFSKKLAEWEKLKKSGPTSPKGEPRQKKVSKDKKDGSSKAPKDIKEKQRAKESPSVTQRSKSPSVMQRSKSPAVMQRSKSPSLAHRSKSPDAKVSRNIVVIEDADGQLKLEGASKEFSKRFQEWEKMRTASANSAPDADTPAARLRKQGSEDVSGSAKSRKDRPGQPRRTQTVDSVDIGVQKNLSATSQEAGSQSEFPDDGRPGDDAVFAETEEHISRLEEKNSFLATQLKRKDVNLQAVQSELETMQHQLEQMGGSKRDLSHKRASTCSSIGESLLEEELNDIKSQVEKLEQQYQQQSKMRKQHSLPSQPSTKSPTASTPKLPSPPSSPLSKAAPDRDEVMGQEVATSAHGSKVTGSPSMQSAQDVIMEESTSSAEPLRIPERTEAEVQTAAQQNSAPNEELKRSLQQRENVIRLLQSELDRQSQEISFLRHQGNAFKRAKSFSARERTYNPAVQSSDPIGGRGLRQTKESTSTSTLSITESTGSRPDGSPSLEALHISAEDIRMEEEMSNKSAQPTTTVTTTTAAAATTIATTTSTTTTIKQQTPAKKESVSSTSKESEDKRAYPGLYGPIETSSRRRRGTDSKEETTSTVKPKSSSAEKQEPAKEAEKPKDDSVDDIVARRRARREARRNERLGITSQSSTKSSSSTAIPEKKEEARTVIIKSLADRDKENAASKSSSPTKDRPKEKVDESPHMQQRRERQSGGAQNEEMVIHATFKLPLSPKSKDKQEREMFSDTTNDSEQETISLRSDSDIRRRFESILAHRRRESSDSVSSSRRSSPSSTGRLYDSNTSRNKTNGDVQNLRKKFANGTPSTAAAGPVKQKSKSLKYEKEKPREGSVKALSQAFAPSDKKDNNNDSNKSSPRSLSPASSNGSLSTGIADKIKKLKNPDERPLERRKSADLIKARVAQLEHDKEKGGQPEGEQRKSMPAIQSVRSKFEKSDTTATAQPPRKTSGRLSYTVSVTDSDKENSESSKKDDASRRPKVKSSRLVAVVETDTQDKKPETVTITINPNRSRRYGTVGDNVNNSNSKQGDPQVKTSQAEITVKEVVKKDNDQKEQSKPKETAVKEDTQAAPGKEEETKEEKRRRRRRERKAAQAAQEEKKSEEASKTEAPRPELTKPEQQKQEQTRQHHTRQEQPKPEAQVEQKETANEEGKHESGKKGRRRHRQRRSHTEDAGDEQTKTPGQTGNEVEPPVQKEEKHQEEAEKEKKPERERRYEKKEDVTKPADRHIQKKDRESTLTALKRMVSKREDIRPEVKVRDQTRARLEGDHKSSSIDSMEGQDYPDLLAQTRLHDKEKSKEDDANGNGKRRPRSMVAESGLKGAAAAIGQPIPTQGEPEVKEKEKEKEKPKEDEGDDRRSRKETTRRGRFMSKADKFDLAGKIRRARSVGPGKKERSPSAERKTLAKGVRSSSIDRSKVSGRATSPDPGKPSKKKGGMGGFLKASNSEDSGDGYDDDDDDEEEDDSEDDSDSYEESSTDVEEEEEEDEEEEEEDEEEEEEDEEEEEEEEEDEDFDEEDEDENIKDDKETFASKIHDVRDIRSECDVVSSTLPCREQKHALAWPGSSICQAAVLSQ